MLAEIAAIPAIQTLIAGLGEAYAPLAAFAGVAAAGIAGAAVRVGSGAVAGGRYVGGQVKSAVDVVAPKIAEGIVNSNKLLTWIGTGIYELVKKIVGAGFDSANFLKEIVDFSALGRINQNVGRVTPVDLLPFNEDDRIAKIRKMLKIKGIERDTLGFLTMLKYTGIAYLEAILTAFSILDIVLIKINREWDIFIWGPKLATKVFKLLAITMRLLGDAYNGFHYIALRVAEQLIPRNLSAVAPMWSKVGAEILLVIKKIIIFGLNLFEYEMKALALVLKAFQYAALVPTIGVLQGFRFALVLLQGTLRVIRGDFSPISGAIEVIKSAISGLINQILKLRSLLIPLGLIGLVLFNPYGVGIGFLLAGLIEASRGFVDLRNTINTILGIGGFFLRLLNDIKWGLIGIGLAVGLGFNPFLRVAVGVIAYLYDMTQGFKRLDFITAKIQGAIASLSNAIDYLLKLLRMPPDFGVLQGVYDFFKENWSLLLAGFVAFNIIVQRSLLGGLKSTFMIVPNIITSVSGVFNVLLGLMARVLPFMSKFRAEVDQLKVSALAQDISNWRENQFGAVTPNSAAQKEIEISRRSQMIKYRELIASHAEEEARKSFINEKGSNRDGTLYEKVNLGKQEGILRTLKAQYQTFDDEKVGEARQKVLTDPKRLGDIAAKAGLSGFSHAQLQVLSSQEGLQQYLKHGEMPALLNQRDKFGKADIMVQNGTVILNGDSLAERYDRESDASRSFTNASRATYKPILDGIQNTYALKRDEISDAFDGFINNANLGSGGIGSAATNAAAYPPDRKNALRSLIQSSGGRSGLGIGAGTQDDINQLRYLLEQLGAEGVSGGGAVPPILRQAEATALQARIDQHLDAGRYGRTPTNPVETYASLMKRVNDGKLIELMKGMGYAAEHINSAKQTLADYKNTRDAGPDQDAGKSSIRRPDWEHLNSIGRSPFL